MDTLLPQQDRELASARQTIAEFVGRNGRLLSEAIEAQIELIMFRDYDAEKERRVPAAEDVTSPLGLLVNRAERLLVLQKQGIGRAAEQAVLETLRRKDRAAEEYDADVEENAEETTEEDEAISSGYIDVGLGEGWRG